jgi:transcription antitermination factor NusG
MGGSYGIPGRVEFAAAHMTPMLRWFALQTRHRFEKKVAAQLDQKNLGVYLPLRTERHTWSDRQKSLTMPLFPGYVFVNIDQSRDARQAVLHTAGLIGFVSFGGVLAAIPSKQIEDLKLLLQQKVPLSLHPFVRVGDRARIRGGCLNGLEGVLLQDSKGKLVVSIESIERSVAIELQGYELDLV